MKLAPSMIKKHEDRISELQSQFDALQIKNNELVEKDNELTGELGQIKEDKKLLEKQIESNESNIADLKSEHEQKMNELNSKLQTCETEKQELQSKIKQNEKMFMIHLKSLNGQVSSVSNSASNVLSDIETSEISEEVTALVNQISDRQKQSQLIQKQNDLNIATIQELESNIQEIERQKQLLEQTKTEDKKKINDINTQLDRYKDDLQLSINTYNELEKKSKNNEEKINQQTKQISELQTKIRELEAKKIDSPKPSIIETQENDDEMDQSIKILTNKLMGAFSDVENPKDSILTKNSDMIGDRLKEFKETIKTIEKQLFEKSRAINLFQKEQEQKEAIILLLKNQRAELEQEVLLLRNQQNENESKLRELKDNQKLVVDENSLIKKQKEQIENDLDNLKLELAQKQLYLDNYGSKIEELETTIKSNNQEHEEYKEQAIQQKNQYDNTIRQQTETISELQSRLKAIGSNIQIKNGQISQSDNAIQELTQMQNDIKRIVLSISKSDKDMTPQQQIQSMISYIDERKKSDLNDLIKNSDQKTKNLVQSLEQEKKRYIAVIEKLDQGKSEIRKQLKNVQKENKEKNRKISNLERFEKKYEKSQRDLENIKSEKNSLQIEKQKNEIEIQQLKEKIRNDDILSKNAQKQFRLLSTIKQSNIIENRMKIISELETINFISDIKKRNESLIKKTEENLDYKKDQDLIQSLNQKQEQIQQVVSKIDPSQLKTRQSKELFEQLSGVIEQQKQQIEQYKKLAIEIKQKYQNNKDILIDEINRENKRVSVVEKWKEVNSSKMSKEADQEEEEIRKQMALIRKSMKDGKKVEKQAKKSIDGSSGTTMTKGVIIKKKNLK